MKLQHSSKSSLSSQKVKVIETHPDYEYAVCGLYTGEVQLITVEKNEILVKKSISLCECPIRTLAICPQNNIILVGTDMGSIAVLDSVSLTTTFVIEDAHSDFIRKIAVNPYLNVFLSCSDDNTVKLQDLSTYACKNVYTDHKHYVMDVIFDKNDSSIFYTACLDGKIRQYSINNSKRLNTLYCRVTDVQKSTKSFNFKKIMSNVSKKKITTSFKAFNNLSGLNSIEISNNRYITGHNSS